MHSVLGQREEGTSLLYLNAVTSFAAAEDGSDSYRWEVYVIYRYIDRFIFFLI